MSKSASAHLSRRLGLVALVIYGVGDILGAGIYALVGKVAGYAGGYTWASFAVAMIIVSFTGFTYGELASRFPQSGGVSIYVQKAFEKEWLSLFVAFLLLCATVLSMATLSQAFLGYLKALDIHVPNWLGIFFFLSALLLINIRGIKQSSITNIISTTVECSGLLIVLVCGFWYLMGTHSPETVSIHEAINWQGVLEGAALAFFAFTGFEDLANIAEEVKHPEKNLPKAILLGLALAGILYLAVSWVATAVVPASVLNNSNSPLLEVVKTAYPPLPQIIFTVIAIFAITNTVLLNYITASRLLYGMAKIRLLPNFLQKIHKKYHTPYAAILLIFPVIFLLASMGTVKGLASSTSAMVLVVFSFSSIALIKIKLAKDKHGKAHFTIPFILPCLAVLGNVIAICFLPLQQIIPAVGLIALGAVFISLYYLIRRLS